MTHGLLISAVAGGLLAAAALSGRVSVDHKRVEAYHAEMRRAIESMPIENAGWAGHEVPIPPSATKLLRPNALVAREFRHQSRTGLAATLLVVQCADIRDMQGHYPPNCYPAHGWTSGETASDAAFGPLHAVRYEFTQTAGNRTRSITVYNLFVLPSGEVTDSMEAVRHAGSDYMVRPYGAAQIQVVIDGTVAREHHQMVLDEMYEIARPVVTALLAGAGEHAKGASR